MKSRASLYYGCGRILGAATVETACYACFCVVAAIPAVIAHCLLVFFVSFAAMGVFQRNLHAY